MAKKKKKKESTKKRNYMVARITKSGYTIFDRAEPVPLSKRVYRRYPELRPLIAPDGIKPTLEAIEHRKKVDPSYKPNPPTSGITEAYWPKYEIVKYPNQRKLEPGMIPNDVLACLKMTSPRMAALAIYWHLSQDGKTRNYYCDIEPHIVYGLLPVLDLLRFKFKVTELDELLERHPILNMTWDLKVDLKSRDWMHVVKDGYGKQSLLERHKETLRDYIEWNRSFGFYSIPEFIQVIHQIGELERGEIDQWIELPSIEIEDRPVAESSYMEWVKDQVKDTEHKIRWSAKEGISCDSPKYKAWKESLEDLKGILADLEAREKGRHPKKKELPEGFGLTVLR